MRYCFGFSPGSRQKWIHGLSSLEVMVDCMRTSGTSPVGHPNFVGRRTFTLVFKRWRYLYHCILFRDISIVSMDIGMGDKTVRQRARKLLGVLKARPALQKLHQSFNFGGLRRHGDFTNSENSYQGLWHCLRDRILGVAFRLRHVFFSQFSARSSTIGRVDHFTAVWENYLRAP